MKSILKKNIKILFLVAFFLIITNLLSVTHPLVLKQILDIDLNDTNIVIILRNLVILYITAHILLIISKDLRNTVINKAMSKILKDLREKLFCHVLKWNMGTYQKYNSSEIYTRLTADIDNVSALFLGTLQVLVNDVLYIALMVVFMFLADVKLAIIGCIAMVITSVVSYIFTHQVAKANKQILNKRDKENRQYSEMYNKNKLIYLFGLQKNTERKIHKTLDEELEYRRRFIFVESFIYPLSVTIQALSIYFILQYVFNIIGDESITDEQIKTVAKEIGFESTWNKFKDGLDEKISKYKLSYGQLQMIAFLRAILHKANIYIFDEPTSNIDLKTEDRIQKLIDRITKESTVIIIAHRKSTIENSDKIIYLKDGKVDMIKNKFIIW